jgi:hypothetical protein
MDYQPTRGDVFEYFVEILEKDEHLFYAISKKLENQLSLKDPRSTHEELDYIFDEMLNWGGHFGLDMKDLIKAFAEAA